MLPCFCVAMHMRKRSSGSFLSRALSETKLEAQVEVSANKSGTLNESKPMEQHEFSERDKQKTFIATSFNINYRDFAQVMVYL